MADSIILVLLVVAGAAALINLFFSLFTLEYTRRIMSQLDDLKAAEQASVDAVNKLRTDTATALTDIANKLATLGATQQDPAVTAEVNNAIGVLNKGAADLAAVDASVIAADPGVPVATPPTPAASGTASSVTDPKGGFGPLLK